MNNKKAFTLVELLAVIIIIALIAIVLIPNINKATSRVKKNIYNTKVKSILKAYKMCKQDGNKDCFSVKSLLDKEYLSKETSTCSDNCLKNPKDNTYLDNCFVNDYDLECDGTAENAIEKIKGLVSGADENSIDVIDKGSTGSGYDYCTYTFAYDGTNDNNLRYVGANPCNYVKIGVSQWRIIGIMNNTTNDEGIVTSRLKIETKYSLGNNYFDPKNKKWAESVLKDELNGDYLNYNLKERVTWYGGILFYPYSTLRQWPQSMMENMVWKLGGIGKDNSDYIPYNTYELERSDAKTPNSSRPTQWTGKVGLPYPSDYAFSTAGGSTVSRSTCLNSLSLDSRAGTEKWGNQDYWDCDRNTWENGSWSWTITPGYYDHDQAFCMIVNHDSHTTVGIHSGYGSASRVSTFPTVYLKPDVNIIKGDGSPNNPYILSY